MKVTVDQAFWDLFPTASITVMSLYGIDDEDISKEEILKQGLATPEEYEILEKYTLAQIGRASCRERV